MQPISRGIDDDDAVRAALEWFHSVASDHAALRQRIRAAQAYFRSRFAAPFVIWPAPADLVVRQDVIASYLAQADSLLTDNRSFDATLGSIAVPWIKCIGFGVSALRRMPGVAERVRRLLDPKQDHPEGVLYELVTAARYAREEFDVEFIPESAMHTADLRLGPRGDSKDLHIECKRLRPSDYERQEAAHILFLFQHLAALADDRGISVWVDVSFTEDLAKIPQTYLVDRVMGSLSSRLVLPAGYPWKDEFGEGVVRNLSLDAVSRDTHTNGPILVGAKLWRLLTGGYLHPGTHHFALRARRAPEDPRYVDKVQMATVLSWQCISESSIEARGRHVSSLLAKIDRQMQNAPMAMAHIGMYAERDTVAADRRRERNQVAVKRFKAHSNLLQINLHYYLNRISEAHSWTIDETVDCHGHFDTPLLDDPKLLSAGGSDIESDQAAWHLPPPPWRRGQE